MITLRSAQMHFHFSTFLVFYKSSEMNHITPGQFFWHDKMIKGSRVGIVRATATADQRGKYAKAQQTGATANPGTMLAEKQLQSPKVHTIFVFVLVPLTVFF